MSKSGVGLKRAIGLMSGTSMDGIDVALIDTDGENHVVRGPGLTLPYNSDDRRILAHAMAAASACQSRHDRPMPLRLAEDVVTRLAGAAVSAFLAQYGIERGSIDIIGFHGQTVLHKTVERKRIAGPEPRALLAPPIVDGVIEDRVLTIQLGDGQRLATMTGIPVVYDLRAADAAAGGEGAPLVPVYHQALVARIPQRPVAVVNIGGVANVTYIGRDGALLAFDTGPGNAMIDDWLHNAGLGAFDEGGAVAASGIADDAVVLALLANTYFAEPPPKSLDRNAFRLEGMEHLGPQLANAGDERARQQKIADGAATLTAFTAQSIARAREHFPEQPELWIVCGGGRRNRTLMTMLAGRVDNAVVPAEAAGLNGDAIEAEAWAYLAVRSMKRLPITFPGTTGVPGPTTGGVLAVPETR